MVPQQPKPASESGRPVAERQFVDREELIALFHTALREPQRTKPLVLVFHGGAGIGKSRLRHELIRLVDSRQQTVDRAVVTATLDFDVSLHRQPDAALFSLRKAIGEACKAGFPSFDLAYAVLWQKTHPDTTMGLPLLSAVENGGCTEQKPAAAPFDELRTLLEPGSLLSQLLDESGKLPLIGLVPKIAAFVGKSPEPPDPRTPEPPLRAWWERRGERELEDLPQMEPAAIVECLPKLWAADLKESLVHRSSFIANRRAVLFIDSYEKLWETGSSEADFFKRDEWVRELVKQLPEALWVISGRQRLRWEEVEKEWGDVLSQHELGALPERSARQFLSSCGITNEPTQDAIAKGSQGVPHYLNLAVDTFLEIKQSGQRVPTEAESASTPEEVFAQFIRHLDQPEIATLQILSASRFWNYGLFEHLVTEYQTGYPLTAYDDLNRFSFVGEGAAPETRTMHELMREALQEHQAPELRKRVHLFLHELYAKQLEGLDVNGITEKHKAALTEAFYHGRQAKSAQELWTRLKASIAVFDGAGHYRLVVPLYREMAQALETELGTDHTDTAAALHALAVDLTNQGEYDQAELLLQRALAAREKLLGPEHLDVAGTLGYFAHLRLLQGRYADAESLLRRAHAVMEKLLGADHSDSAANLSNLGSVLYRLGRCDEAEPLLRRSLATMERALGPEHLKVAVTLDTLASVLHAKSKYLEAEALYRRALAIAEKALGPEHPTVATFQSNFADLLIDEGKCAEGETLARRSLAIREKALGLQHHYLAYSLNLLARLCSGRGEHTEADALFRRALAIEERVLGPQHPQVAKSLGFLARSLGIQDKYAEAEPLLRRSLAIQEKALEPEHPDLAYGLNLLAWVLLKQGKNAEVEQLARRAIAIGEKAFGPEHPDLAACLDTLSALLREQRRYSEAEDLARRALAIREAKLGPDNPLVAGTLDILADLLAPQGKHAEAESSARRSLTIREKALGPEHPDVAESLEPLAALLVRQSRYAEAEPLARRALAIREATLNPGHPDIARPLDILAELCEKTGRTSEAEALYRRALAIREKVFGPDHTFVAESLEGLAKVCEQTGRAADALELSERAKAIREKKAETAQRQAPSPS
jgi:Tfp pilus assembly protein PilF